MTKILQNKPVPSSSLLLMQNKIQNVTKRYNKRKGIEMTFESHFAVIAQSVECWAGDWWISSELIACKNRHVISHVKSEMILEDFALTTNYTSGVDISSLRIFCLIIISKLEDPSRFVVLLSSRVELSRSVSLAGAL